MRQLADMVADTYPGHVEVTNLADNPRVEKEEHYYRAAHTKLLDLGLVPHLLDHATVSSLLSLADRHRDRVDPSAIHPTVDWRRTSSVLPQQTAGSGVDA